MAIADYLNKLVELKNQLVANLISMGVAADQSEKLNTLVPKVLESINSKHIQMHDVAGESLDISYLHSRVEKLILPEGITTLTSSSSSETYRYLTGMTEMRLPSTMTDASYIRFAYVDTYNNYASPNLKKITVPISGLTIKFSYSGTNKTAAVSPTEFSFVVGVDGITEISSSSFYGIDKSNLEISSIPDGATKIGNSLYSGCEKLLNINLPDSITFIGYDAFKNTAIVNQQTDPVKYIDKWAVAVDSNVEDITIKEGTVGLINRLFSNNKTIKSIKLPNGLKYDGFPASGGSNSDGVFYYCSNLLNVELPGDIETISTDMFYYCSSLSNIEIPESVTLLDNACFMNCTGLTEVVLNTKDDTQELQIGNYAFCGCANLTSINLNNIFYIGDCAFKNCEGLSGKILGSIYKIQYDAFSGVSLLCPGNGTDIRQAPWGALNIHDFDENGVCKNCGHQTPILFCERTESDFGKASIANVGVTGSSSEYGFRYYGYASGGSNVSKKDIMPIKVFEEITVTIGLRTYNLCYTHETISIVLYKVDESGNKTQMISKSLSGTGNGTTNDSTTVTITLEPGEYQLYATYKAGSGSGSSRGGSYYIPERLTY